MELSSIQQANPSTEQALGSSQNWVPDVHHLREGIRLHEQRCFERFGTKSIQYGTALTPEQVARVERLIAEAGPRVNFYNADFSINPASGMTEDDWIDRRILQAQRAKEWLQDHPWHAAKAARGLEKTGDPWAYWASYSASPAASILPSKSCCAESLTTN